MAKCCYCEREFSKYPGAHRTREHIIPLSKGGNHHTSNIRWACSRCNSSKSNKDYILWQLELGIMLSARDESLFTISEMKKVIEKAGVFRRLVENSTSIMWYSGRVGVIEKIRKIKNNHNACKRN